MRYFIGTLLLLLLFSAVIWLSLDIIMKDPESINLILKMAAGSMFMTVLIVAVSLKSKQ